MDWGTVAPKFDIIPPRKPDPVKFNYMFQMEVIKPAEPLWLSIWRHECRKDLELYLWRCRLVDTLILVIRKRHAQNIYAETN